jgi:hypothetical protein
MVNEKIILGVPLRKTGEIIEIPKTDAASVRCIME